MQVIKKLNNNFALCLDSNGVEMIAYGKGIGFPPTPYEVIDLNQIRRTFYDISSDYLGMMESLPG